MKRIAFVGLTILVAFAVIDCSWWSRRVKLGEQFTMHPKEKVAVAGTELTIRLDEVGHQTFSGRSSDPAAYVVLQLTSERGSRSSRIGVGESTEQDAYVIHVNSAYPFHSQDGPRCELIVNRAKKSE
ncbi:MAG TPA: hypothetical protein VGJ69_09265 [Pyrinomonadaceae bacterium]|jgi:hypothetical protein